MQGENEMSIVLDDAKRYLWLSGTDITVDPVELIRDLTVELAKHEETIPQKKKPKARPK